MSKAYFFRLSECPKVTQDHAQEARVEVRVENTRKTVATAGRRGVDRRARRHLRRREVEITLLVAGLDRQEEKSDIPGVGVVLLVLIDLVDR